MIDSSQDVESTARDWVWVPDKNTVFRKGFIIENLEDNKVKIEFEDTKQDVFDASKVEKVNPAKFDKADDMAELTFLNEPSVLNNLERRYNDDLIYTYSGLFLVAVNPYSKLPIYDDEQVRMYNNIPKDQTKPHIFAETEETYQNMLKNKRDQSILVTGESGAGKTENTKKIIQYLAAITTDPNQETASFEKQIIQANPILESFGNAQTVRNHNSSRFGKFIKIEFDSKGKIGGAHIDWYLLEKSRVVKQSKQERNYHIFYQLLAGLSEKELSLLGLKKSPMHYEYLKAGNDTIPGVDDKKEFKDLKNALDIMGVPKAKYYEIFKLIAIILHIGNIEFTSMKAEQANFKSSVDTLCELLGVSKTQFNDAILRPKVKAGKEFVKQSRNASQAKFSLDALSKSLYEKVFKFLVDAINENLDHDSTCQNFIGVLDIAGFEIFKENSFEQLCINYTNEKLQQFFNHHMFVLEQNEYIKENIDWDFIDFGQDLQQTIDLIEKQKPVGIFSVLDEECIVPRSTDKSFFEKLNSFCNGKSEKYKPSRFASKFSLKHYAGDVEYSVEGWIEKNRDPLNDNIVDVLANSENSFIAGLYENDQVQKSSSFRTVAQKHKEQLGGLLTQLSDTHPHFVRCILPNNKKKPQTFDKSLVLEQLKCNGVLEGIRIVRSGFPNRVAFDSFFSRYKILADHAVFSETLKTNCTTVLSSIKLDSELYKVGSTKVFFKAGVLADLEVQRDNKIRSIVTELKAIARGKLRRKSINTQLQKIQASQVLMKAFNAYNKLDKNAWFKLYADVKPFISTTGQAVKTKQIQDHIKNLESKLESLEKEKSEINTKSLTTEEELTKLECIVETERAILKEKESILEETKQREKELEGKLESTMTNMKDLEDQRDAFKKSKQDLDEKLKSFEENIKNGKQLVKTLEKEKEMLNSKIDKLENSLKEAQNSQKSYAESTEKIGEELKMLKALLKSKEKLISELEAKIENSDYELQGKVSEITSSYNNANKRIKELVEENKNLHSKLKTLQDSSSQYEIVMNKKESDLEHIKAQLKQQAETIKSIEAERDMLKREQGDVASELAKVKSEMVDLRSKHKQLEHEANEARELLQRKISDEVTFNRGKQKYDSDISELKLHVSKLNEQLSEERSKSYKLSSEVRSLKIENDDLQKDRKATDVRVAQGALQAFRSKSLNSHVDNNVDRLHDEKEKLTREYANLKLQLNEQSAMLKKETIEKTKMKADLKMLHSRLASEAFDKQQLKIQLNKIKEGLGLSPLSFDEGYDRLSRENENLSRQISNLRTDLDLERKASERANKNPRRALADRNSMDSPFTLKHEFNSYKAKYEASEARIRLLERKLAEDSDSFRGGSVLNNRGLKEAKSDDQLSQAYQDTCKSLSLTKEELAKSKYQISQLQKDLSEATVVIEKYKASEIESLSNQLAREELTKVQLQLEALLKKNSDLSNNVKLYKVRAEDYYAKLESAEAAVRTAKHSEKFTKEQLQEAIDSVEKLKNENRKSEVAIVKLNQNISQLREAIEERQSEFSKLQSSNIMLQEEVGHYHERLMKSSRTDKYDAEIQKLNDELVRSMRNETELRKDIGSLELELENLQSQKAQEVRELTKEKSYYLRLVKDLEDKNEESSVAQKDLEVKLRSLMNQISTMNDSVDKLIRERDNLESDKKSLELQIRDLSGEYKNFSNERELAQEKYYGLEQSIEKYLSEIDDLKKEKKKSNSLQEDLRAYIEEEKQRNVIISEENNALGKYNNQLKDKILELETKFNEIDDSIWLERIEKLEQRLQIESNEKHESIKSNRNMERTVDELKDQVDRQAKQMASFEDAKEKYEMKISDLLNTINKWQIEDSSTKLSLKRSEREIKHLQESNLELEREIEEWKDRFDKVTTKRKSLVSSDVFI
ncbi:Myosin-7 [Wickerhamomyces ciferrii]|uniref:Myosin-7 n=1 Tax=Wickerhamomyces ciferrii (strain ATCC 14091 / BCRC 22168 / CBS 111 / JCM 3599 / NBRC 0793 / NRRL Y-1031 F-60-10) TaxID=1206466 RepID=K0KMB0_WICCF|nr:Myosin-7 [Wickerhamomyces ciferrii]CCH46395.1 Myosin-7 [Wickerhamomyces ciferrii]